MYLVRFADESLNKSLEKLKIKDVTLYNKILFTISKLEREPFNSIIIKKKQIPKIYVRKYGIDNLRMIKVNQDWRLLYTIASNEIRIMSIVLEWLDHKEYENRFNYCIT